VLSIIQVGELFVLVAPRRALRAAAQEAVVDGDARVVGPGAGGAALLHVAFIPLLQVAPDLGLGRRCDG
jgi:hypothetical protein